jgi:hypothetical protein
MHTVPTSTLFSVTATRFVVKLNFVKRIFGREPYFYQPQKFLLWVRTEHRDMFTRRVIFVPPILYLVPDSAVEDQNGEHIVL